VETESRSFNGIIENRNFKSMEQEIEHVLISIVKGTAQADNVFVFLIVDKFICTFVK
jgi:hypothetical protein